MSDQEARIAALEAEIVRLRAAASLSMKTEEHTQEGLPTLSAAEIQRYSRQMIVPSFGAWTQRVLSALRVLIVGAGGLGCPAALYLASSGVGFIGVVDDDRVETENLHRQIGHAERRKGWSKAESLVAAMAALNPHVSFRAISDTRFGPHNAEALVRPYHVVLDCSDNPATRYVCNDACVLSGKILVSGAAVGLGGQLATYNFHRALFGRHSNSSSSSAPCYRCLHPVPPPTGAVVSCSDAGVLGPVTGVIGSLQALEVLKVASEVGKLGGAMLPAWDDKEQTAGWKVVADLHEPPSSSAPSGAAFGFGTVLSGQLFNFDGADAKTKVFKLRPRREDCAVCGSAPVETTGADAPSSSSAPTVIRSLADTAAWLSFHGLVPREGSSAAPCDCETTSDNKVEEPAAALNITVEAFSSALRAANDASSPSSRPALVIDVRSEEQFSMCSLPGSVHIPLRELQRGPIDEVLGKRVLSFKEDLLGRADRREPVYLLCRRGVDSLTATKLLRELGVSSAVNVEGGLTQWAARVDPAFPRY